MPSKNPQSSKVDPKIHLAYELTLTDEKAGFQQGEDDLDRATCVTIGHYMRNEATVNGGKSQDFSRDKFPVIGKPEQPSLKITDGLGKPTTFTTIYYDPVTNPEQEQPTFLRTKDDVTRLNQDSFSHAGSSDLQEGDFVKRDADDTVTKDQIESGLDLTSHNSEYVSPLLKKNRFYPGSEAGVQLGDDNIMIPITSQPGKWTKDQTLVSRKQLSLVGSILSIRATQELGSMNGGINPNAAGEQLSAILPSFNQLGVTKVRLGDLDPVDAAKSAESLVDPPQDAIRINDESWGTFNNVNDQFTGIMPLGMLTLAIALSLAFKIFVRAFILLFQLIAKPSENPETNFDSIGRLKLGVAVGGEGPASFSISFPPLPIDQTLFGLYHTKHEWSRCIDAGMSAFFGEKDAGGILGGLLNVTANVASAPGYYGIFVRNVIRSGALIVQAMIDVGRKFASGAVLDGITGLVGLIGIFKSSKLIASLNIFAQLGDTQLVLRSYDTVGVTDQDGRVSITDAIALSPLAPTHMMSRTFGKAGTGSPFQLSMGTSTVRSVLMLPKAFAGAYLAYGSQLDMNADIRSHLAYANPMYGKDGVSAQRTISRTFEYAFVEPGSPRLNSDDVSAIEATLEAEYVPFYFHDLRTNEIVAFHAFLTSLNESFTSTWNSEEGYGRIDAVKSYKSTSRKIDLSFHIVSTNQEDFAIMWTKLNKLVSLVYPQWSKGTPNKDKNENWFTQPFSQVISASPVIRLRIGDLIRSNFSKFGLARIFGLSQSAFGKVDEQQSLASLAKLGESGFGQIEDIQNAIKSPLGNQFLMPAGVYQIAPKDRSDNVSTTYELSQAHIAKIARTVPGINEAYIAQFADGTELIAFKNQLTSPIPKEIQATDETSQDVFNNLKLSGKEENVIVRSFRDTAGKGLAGVIESLNFDWMGRNWDTSTYGSRAPMSALAVLSFSVIHDIAPGMSADGSDRAPIYNVGRLMNGVCGDGFDDGQRGRKFFDASRKNIPDLLKPR